MTFELIPFLAMYAALAIFAVMVMRKNHDINRQCWRPPSLSKRHRVNLRKRNCSLSRSERRLERKYDEFVKLQREVEVTKREIIVTRKITLIETELAKARKALEELEQSRVKEKCGKRADILHINERTG